MHGFAIGKEHNPKVSLLLLDEDPPPDTTVRLRKLGIGSPKSHFDPRIENLRAVGAPPCVTKVLGGLQLSGRWQVGCITRGVLLRRANKVAAGEHSEPAASVKRRQLQLLVMCQRPKTPVSVTRAVHGRLRHE